MGNSKEVLTSVVTRRNFVGIHHTFGIPLPTLGADRYILGIYNTVAYPISRLCTTCQHLCIKGVCFGI